MYEYECNNVKYKLTNMVHGSVIVSYTAEKDTLNVEITDLHNLHYRFTISDVTDEIIIGENTTTSIADKVFNSYKKIICAQYFRKD